MESFYLFFELGFKHLLSFQAYDHILFLLVLCGTFSLSEWKKVLILVTAFTFGHSITLALSVFSIKLLPTHWIEFVIPITIILTAIINISRRRRFVKNFNPTYIVSIVFGLVHGFGFSNYLRSLLGEKSNLFFKLLAFNIGLEMAQLILVLFILLISFVVIRILRIQKREWHLFLSSVVLGIAMVIVLQRLPIEIKSFLEKL